MFVKQFLLKERYNPNSRLDMSYLNSITVFIVIVHYSCGNPIEVEKKPHSQTLEEKTFSHSTNEEQNVPMLDSILERENRLGKVFLMQYFDCILIIITWKLSSFNPRRYRFAAQAFE